MSRIKMNIERINAGKILCVLAAALVILTGAPAAFQENAEAAAHGVYTVTAAPHYKHPVTGVIEDSGQNPGIGQGMTESVLGRQALLEVDKNGSHFVTVRFSLMDNIRNVKLSVQKNAQSDFKSVQYTVMKEAMAEGTADLRFAVPDENAIARATFYVIPMGRDVVFYMNFSNPVSGSGDFVTSINVEKSPASQQQNTETAKPQQEAQNTETSTPEQQNTEEATTTDPDASPEADAGDSAVDADSGLTVYENNGKAKQKNNNLPRFLLPALAVIALAGIGGVVYYKKKTGKAASSSPGAETLSDGDETSVRPGGGV